jgi:hypothetical protein
MPHAAKRDPVLAARAREAAHFYEAACRNRGWLARVLPDRESAIDWLKDAG